MNHADLTAGELALLVGSSGLMDALGHAGREVFPEQTKPALTKRVSTEPVQRLLADAGADGSLEVSDPEDTATVLVNLVGPTYRHLLTAHGWSAKRARQGVLDLALRGVIAR